MLQRTTTTPAATRATRAPRDRRCMIAGCTAAPVHVVNHPEHPDPLAVCTACADFLVEHLCWDYLVHRTVTDVLQPAT